MSLNTKFLKSMQFIDPTDQLNGLEPDLHVCLPHLGQLEGAQHVGWLSMDEVREWVAQGHMFCPK